MIKPATQAWLTEFLRDCDRSPRLNDFETSFVAGIGRRFAREHGELVITEAQWPVLRRIEEKIHAAG